MAPVLVAFGTAIYGIREPLLRVRFGFSGPLSVVGVILLAIGFYIGIRRMPYLKISVMLGVPELSKQEGKGKLLTEGIYGVIRHPRYLEIGFSLAGIALFVNYLAVYILFIVYVPVIYIVVLLEERELRQRFGEEYDMYCRKVPRFIPKFGRK
jgi:protein-S-isoprenylcysteine O-methyltransferase Ste14